jgi:hypothetical protein
MGPLAIPDEAMRWLLYAQRAERAGAMILGMVLWTNAARRIREANPEWWPAVEA